MRRLLPLISLTFVVLLTGCTVRFDSIISVEEDGSGTLAIEVGLDEEFRNLLEEQGDTSFAPDPDADDIPPGWTVEEFIDGDFEGFRVSVDFADLSELDRRLAELAESAEEDDGGAAPALLEPGILTQDGDAFHFSMPLQGLEEDLSAASGGDDAFGDIDFEQLMTELFEIRFLVTLPGSITDHNADRVEGSTLVWEIGLADEGTTLSASSQLGGGSGVTTILLIVVAVILVAVAGFFAVTVIRRRGGGDGGTPSPPGDEEVAVAADPEPI